MSRTQTAPVEEASRCKADASIPPRSATTWNALGMLVSAGVVVLVAAVALGGTALARTWLLAGLFVIGLSIAAAYLVARSQRLELSRSFQLMARIWTEPVSTRAVFLLGLILTIPIAAMHTTVIVGDSDSARLLASILYVQRNGLRYLVETQENFLPHILLGPFVTFGGIAGAKLFSVLSVQLLAATLSVIVWRGTRSMVAVLATILAFYSFPSLISRAFLLPMYPTMLLFGVLGLYMAWLAIQNRSRRRWVLAGLSGTFLVLSPEAHGLGQLFLIMPLFLIVTTSFRNALDALTKVYAFAAVAYIPRVVINTLEGGLDRFLGYRVDYWITEGYVSLIQERFWKVASRLDLGTYLVRLVERLDTIYGVSGLVVLGVAAIAVPLSHRRLRWLGFLLFSFVMVAAINKRVPFYSRYFTQIQAGAVLAAGAANALLLKRNAVHRAIAWLCIATMAFTAWVSYRDVVESGRQKQGDVRAAPYDELLSYILEDDKAVIGARVGHLHFVSDEVQTYGGQFLGESEYVTYLTWPSDEEVLEMMREHNIGWALVSPTRRMEITYHNTWLIPAWDERARHVGSLRESRYFCRQAALGGYELYRLGSCL